MEKIKKQLLTAYIGENVAGGFYLQLAKFHKNSPKIAERLNITAGDELRHGEYFNQCHYELYGNKWNARDGLMFTGKILCFLMRLAPKYKLLNWMAAGESVAVKTIEKEIRTEQENPYIKIITKILPDERMHAEPY